MNKKLKQLSAQFPDLLSTYKTNWSPEPFDFLLQEEKTVIDIDTVESLSKNKEQILKKVKCLVLLSLRETLKSFNCFSFQGMILR
jgi:hypothetical protein